MPLDVGKNNPRIVHLHKQFHNVYADTYSWRWKQMLYGCYHVEYWLTGFRQAAERDGDAAAGHCCWDWRRRLISHLQTSLSSLSQSARQWQRSADPHAITHRSVDPGLDHPHTFPPPNIPPICHYVKVKKRLTLFQGMSLSLTVIPTFTCVASVLINCSET